MARYVRQIDAVGVDALEADLRQCREAGGIDLAAGEMLIGAMAALQLEGDRSDRNVGYAREVLRGLTELAIDDILRIHPLRERRANDSSPLKTSWQSVGATSLRSLLLTKNGTGRLSVSLRNDLAAELGRHPTTVKRAEDSVISLIAAYVFDRITNEPSQYKPPTSTSNRSHTRADVAADPLLPLLGASEHDIASSLLDSARLPGWGFESQEVARHEPSRVSTGLVTYALATIPTVDDTTISEIYNEIVSWVGPGGVLPRSDGGVETTWTASQCLLALTARPDLVDERHPLRLAGALMRYQADGRWSYRADGEAHPLFSFYPLLALRRCAAIGWVTGLAYKKVAVDSARHLEDWIGSGPHEPVDAVLGLAALRLALDGGGGQPARYSTEVRRVRKTFTSHFAAELGHVDIADDRQPVWHARVSPVMLYLHARRVLGSNHTFTVRLAQRLIDEFDPVHRGWTNSARQGARPYSWTTALGLMSCRGLRSDLLAGLVTPADLRPRDDEAVA